MNGANYSTTSDEMLCKTCKYGQVLESGSGGTVVLCHCQIESESSHPQRLDMLVTKCNRYEHPELLRIWDTQIALHIEDGHCWLSNQRYVPALGHVHIRVDTVGKRFQVFKEHPGREWDSEEGHWAGEAPPTGHGIVRWFRRLQSS
jgi:hypothetical protein